MRRRCAAPRHPSQIVFTGEFVYFGNLLASIAACHVRVSCLVGARWCAGAHQRELGDSSTQDAEAQRLQEYIGKTALLAYLDEKAKKTGGINCSPCTVVTVLLCIELGFEWGFADTRMRSLAVIGAFQKKTCSKDEEVIKQVFLPGMRKRLLARLFWCHDLLM